jgi:hypothetical protein
MSEESRHVYRTVTPEEAARNRAIAEAEHTPEAKAANLAKFRRMQAAEAEEGFLGDLRRGISAALIRERKGVFRFAEQVGIDADRLESFREGEATLSSDTVARLVEMLGLHLTADAHSA